MKQFNNNLLYVILGIAISQTMHVQDIPSMFGICIIIGIVFYCFYGALMPEYWRRMNVTSLETEFTILMVPLILMSAALVVVTLVLRWLIPGNWFNQVSSVLIIIVVMFFLDIIHTIFFNYIKTK